MLAMFWKCVTGLHPPPPPPVPASAADVDSDLRAGEPRPDAAHVDDDRSGRVERGGRRQLVAREGRRFDVEPALHLLSEILGLGAERERRPEVLSLGEEAARRGV